MKVLKTTTPFIGLNGKAHDHIVYLNPEGQPVAGPPDPQTGQPLLQIGQSSFDLNHAHGLIYHPATPGQAAFPGQQAQTDPMTGQEIPEIPPSPEIPPTPEWWEVAPGPDGHTHDITEYELTPPKKEKDSDEAIAAEVLGLFRAGLELEGDSRKDADESDDFYAGKQWSDSQRQNLEGANRCCLTINETERGIDELSGYQTQQRMDLRYLPMEGGDQRVCDALNIVSKNILEQCFFPREEGKAFLDMAIRGRGDFNLYVDFSSNLQGDIKVERFPDVDVVYGPHEKEDLADCEYIVKHKMFSEAKIKQLWPIKAKDIERGDGYGDLQDETKTGHKAAVPDQYRAEDSSVVSDNFKFPLVVGELAMKDVARKEHRVLERWRKVYTPAVVLVQPNDDFYFNAFGWKPRDVKRAKTIPGFVDISRTVTKFRISRVCAGVVLTDENPADLPVDDFFMVPMYAKKRGNKYWGKIQSVKDPQREVNKRASQSIDIGNKMAAYGWFIDEQTFEDSNEEGKFRANSASPGFVQRVRDTEKPPKQVEGVKFPSEIAELGRVASERLKYLLNTTVTPSGANESAQHLLQLQKIQLTGNEYLFENLGFAKKKVGRLLLSLIQRYWSPERMLRLLQHERSRRPEMELGEQNFDDFSEEEILELLRTTDLLQYDTVVGESNFSPTVRNATAVWLSELQKGGAPIPPKTIIRMMDIPEAEKQQIFAEIAAQEQAAAAGQADAGKTEIQKTLIAQGIIPPEVRQTMGLGNQQVPGAQPEAPAQIQNDGTGAAGYQ